MIYQLILIVILAIEPLAYMIARNKGMKEAKGWKKAIPFLWIFL
jgi:hypothetical protein